MSSMVVAIVTAMLGGGCVEAVRFVALRLAAELDSAALGVGVGTTDSFDSVARGCESIEISSTFVRPSATPSP